jgi:protein FAM32A
VTRKKKKKSHTSSDRSKVESEVQQSERREKEKGKGREERADSGEIVIKNVAPGEGRRMTESERKFEEVQRLRVSPSLIPSYGES